MRWKNRAVRHKRIWLEQDYCQISWGEKIEKQACYSEFFVITTSFSLSAFLLGFSALFCSFLTVLFDSPHQPLLFTQSCRIPVC